MGLSKREFSQALEAIQNRFSGEHADAVRADLNRLREAGVASLDTLIATIGNEKMPVETRCSACWLLARIGHESSAHVLTELFDSRERGLRIASVRYFAELRGSGFENQIISILKNDSDPEVRFAAAYALGLLGLDGAIAPLLEVARNQLERPSVRGGAIEALADIRNKEVLKPLIMLLSDPVPEVRFWAVFALGQLGEKSAIPALEKLKATDSSTVPGWRSIQQECEEAIQQLNHV